MDKSLLPRNRSNKNTRPERVLLICYFDPNGISTVPENIRFLQLFSSLSIDVYNFFGQQTPFVLKQNFPIADYNAIVFHNTVTCYIEGLLQIDKLLRLKLHEYPGLKILFKQDEHILPIHVSKFIGRIKADIVFSCLPESEHLKVYPEEVTGKIKFVSMLTGYVTPNMRKYKYSQKDKRPIDVGYRGSLQPIFYGRLAYEKQQIAYDFMEASKNTDLMLDISCDWNDRLSGESWIKFLASSKATLGAESGASIFDFEGEVEQKYGQLVKQKGEFPQDRKWSENILSLLSEFEGKIFYNQVSPRHFEACATRTLQLLYEGSYSGIFLPDRHYIPVKKDFNNFEEVIEALKDLKKRCEITEQAFDEIILNENYWIESFAKKFDTVIIQFLSDKEKPIKKWQVSGPTKINVLLLCGHRLNRDPRLHWISKFAPSEICFHLIGIHDDPFKVEENVFKNELSGFEVEVFRKGGRNLWPANLSFIINHHNIGTNAISFLYQLGRSKNDILAYYAGADPSDSRLDAFKWYLSHFYDTSTALVYNGSRFKGIDIVVATDLDTLAAGIVLKEHFNASLVYDAHEFWPESDVENTVWETDFWYSLEKHLISSVDFASTVSSHLAEYMSRKYKKKFISLPNCVPLGNGNNDESANPLVSFPKVAFLYQGNYAKGRGLEILIDIWPQTNQNAFLFLRGPNNLYQKELLSLGRRTGLLDKRIFFLKPVSEDELVLEARAADVGLIPYEPICINHKYCCPNKLSQFCIAGLPLLVNRTDYIAEIVNENRIGIVADFNRSKDLIQAVNKLTSDNAVRAEMGRRALLFGTREFYWEKVSIPFYDNLRSLSSKKIGTVLPKEAFILPPISIQTDAKPVFGIVLRRVLFNYAFNPKNIGTKLYHVLRIFWRLIPTFIRYKLFSILASNKNK